MTSAKCWRTAAVVCLLTLAAVAGTAATVDGHYTLKTVVIDAGHGGKDPGATNRWGLREKDITLAVSLRLRDYLREKTSLNLVMTRDGDTYPTLPERAQIANRYEPLESVFVSIHCNASTNSAANGAETYVYDNEASDAKAQRVAARENQGQDFSLSFILNDLRHRAMKPYTDALADKIQDNLVSSVKVVDRRVQRGPFYVLFYPSIPSVLIEIGFITNRSEQQLLASAEYQSKIARAIGDAIIAFGRDTDAWRLASTGSQ